MAKLYFQYSTMNAGKSTLLLQASHNYRERGMQTYLLTAQFDNRAGEGQIGSRIGISQDADTFAPGQNLYDVIEAHLSKSACACVFIDEAQFLEEAQVWQLARAVDDLNVPVMCYGLRVDFQGKLFPVLRRFWHWPTKCAKFERFATAEKKRPWWCGKTKMARP